MDAIPYVDSLVKEYLLFRGFTSTLSVFNQDLRTDRGRGFQADQLCKLVFRQLLPQSEATELMEVLDFLGKRVYSRLPGSYEPMIRKLEVSILRAHLVLAIQAGKPEVVKHFFTQHAELLLQQAEASDWLAWFALPYMSDPATDERFKVYFSKDWMGLVETSFRNLVSQGIQHLPLPGLLHFNTDRLERQALRKQIEELQASIHELKQQSVSKTGNLSATPPAQPSNHQQQPQASSRGNLPNQHEPAASQERRQAQKDIRSHSNLTQSKAAKPSSAAPPPPKPISTAIKPHHATKPTEAVVMQWELTHDRQAGAAASLPSTTGQQATAHANIGRTPDAEASSQASANASLGGTAELMSTVADTTISDHLQGSQADTGLPYTEANGIHSTPQDERQAADTTGEKAQLPAAEAGSPISTAAAAAAGWPGKPVSGHTSLDHISLIKQEHLADTTTGSLATREQAASSTDTAGDAGGSDEAQLNGLVTQEEQLLGHDHCISCCSFSPNGQNLATASTDGVVRIWAPESLQSNASRAAVLLCGAPVSAVAWDNRADKIMLVGTRGKGIKAWHLDTKSMISHIQPDSSYPHVLDVACSPTDPSFVSAASTAAVATAASDADCASGTLTMWNMRAFRRLRNFDLPESSAAGSVAFSPDGQTLVAGVSDGTLRIFDVHSSRGAPVAAWGLQTHNCKAASVQYCANGSGVVSLTQSGLLQQWDLRRLSSKKLGQPQWSVDLSNFCTSASSVQSLAVALSSRSAAMNSATDEYPVVQLDNSAPQPSVHALRVPSRGVLGQGSYVSAVGWHPNGSALCCGLNQGHVYLQHLNLK